MKDYFDWIEAYCNGTLQPDERLEFEGIMASDPELKAAVDHFPLAKKLATGFIELETARHLEALAKPKHNYTVWAIAALLLIFIAVFIIIKSNISNQDTKLLNSDQIFASLYEAPASISQRSEQELTNALDTAIFLFEKGQWGQSKLFLSNILELQPDDSIALRYLAHSYFQTQQFDSALYNFKALQGVQNFTIQNDAKYHLMILYLMQNDMAQTKILFEDLKKQNAIGSEKLNIIESFLK